MTSGKTARRRPPIHMIQTEADALADLAISVQDRLPQVSALLLTEISRAHLHDVGKIPADVVRMHSTVEFTDSATGTRRKVRLVYPKDADIADSRISILTPVGAGLIGMRAGDGILWPDRGGRERALIIEKVMQQ